jgi:pyrimidine-nucleoside phosphorylase
MHAHKLIHKKRNGVELTGDEIRWLIARFAGSEVTDAQMAAFLMAVSFRGMSAAETAALTMAMVESGETLDLRGIRGPTVDKHSTGGVGDKTSLVLVPLVASAGIRVAKLSGRALGHTGGTLDKLESIPGFRVELSPAELIDQVNRIGCAIASQSARLVPADKQLYALRNATATVDTVPLIASSVMSKKIASGSEAIVLDVKAGTGAFTKTVEAARKLAAEMVEIGRSVGRRTAAVVSAMDEPLGRAIGGALEVDEAIRTLRGEGPADLRQLCLALGTQMLILGGLAPDPASGRALLTGCLERGEGWRTFREMVAAQGGDPGVVDHPERLPHAPVQQPVPSIADGTVLGVDAEALGEAAMILGAGHVAAGDRIDPAAGLVIERKTGDQVRRGDTLAVLHTHDAARAQDVVLRVQAAYRIGPGRPAPVPLVQSIVN